MPVCTGMTLTACLPLLPFENARDGWVDPVHSEDHPLLKGFVIFFTALQLYRHTIVTRDVLQQTKSLEYLGVYC